MSLRLFGNLLSDSERHRVQDAIRRARRVTLARNPSEEALRLRRGELAEIGRTVIAKALGPNP